MTSSVPMILGGDRRTTIAQREVLDVRGEVVGTCSVAPSVAIAQTARSRAPAGFAALQALPIADVIAAFERAARILLEGRPAGLDAAEYATVTARCTGLPIATVRKNGLGFLAERLRAARTTLERQSPSGDIGVFESGLFVRAGATIGFTPRGRTCGVVIPGNLPSANFIWLTALAMRWALLLRPSFDDPFTPWRLVEALLEAGIPGEALSLLPCDHDGSDKIVATADRTIVFGGDDVARRFAPIPTAKVYGPGHSKVVVSRDACANLDRVTDVVLDSLMGEAGRACISASAVIVPAGYGEEMAHRLARRLAEIPLLDPLDERAQLAAFRDDATPAWIEREIATKLAHGGATDVTAAHRRERALLVRAFGTRFLLPQVVLCDQWRHPLFGDEYAFPFVTVAEVPREEVLASARGALVLSILGRDQAPDEFLREPTIHKVLVERSTLDNDPADPHEGLLSEFLFAYKAFRGRPD